MHASPSRAMQWESTLHTYDGCLAIQSFLMVSQIGAAFLTGLQRVVEHPGAHSRLALLASHSCPAQLLTEHCCLHVVRVQLV